MASIISQPGLGLTAPSSRQDIISALLNDYGNSFGADTSPYSSYSPNPALKELPPPPPKDDGKPLSGLMMRFQLRVDEPQSPFSPFEERKASPTKIVYRSMSRNSKPPSLKLLKSNGATAIIPQSQAPPAPAKDIYSSLNSIQDRPLPPPPPPKSERRQSSMGNGTSKPERRDSKDPQDSRSIDSSASVSVPPVKRKPVPAAKGFSLADLGAGPRGRKPVANEQDNPRRPSVARSENETPAPRAPSANRANLSKQELPAPPIHQDKAEAPLPPPPPEKEQLTLPPAPRKALGLPSNPRAKGQDTSMSSKHIRGKSSTGLDIMKAANNTSSRAAASKLTPIIAPPVLSTITPDQTPSPRKTEAIQTGAAVQGISLANTIQAALHSPVSPVDDEDDDSRRPFSFEGAPAPKRTPNPGALARSVSPVSPPAQASSFPPRSTSRPVGAQPSPPVQRQQQQQSQFQAARPAPPPPVRASREVVPRSQSPSQSQSQSQLQSQRPQSQQQFQASRPAPRVPPQQQAPQSFASQPWSTQPFSSDPINREPVPAQRPSTSTSTSNSNSNYNSNSNSNSNSTSTSSSSSTTSSDPQTVEPRFPLTPPPSFIPLTKLPIPMAPKPITSTHLACYTSHAVLTRYNARFQPPGCMVCHEAAPGFRAMCTCCFLSVCGECDREFGPGKDLEALVEKRGGINGEGKEKSEEGGKDAGPPWVVVSDEGDDFS